MKTAGRMRNCALAPKLKMKDTVGVIRPQFKKMTNRSETRQNHGKIEKNSDAENSLSIVKKKGRKKRRNEKRKEKEGAKMWQLREILEGRMGARTMERRTYIEYLFLREISFGKEEEGRR